MMKVNPVIYVDALLLIFLIYKIIKEIILNHEWKMYGCTKPFGLFLIAQSIDVIIFRLFYYLERHWYYREVLARIRRNAELEVYAHTMVRIMRGFKFAASLTFLALTALATLWIVQDTSCSRVLMANLRNWVILSWGVCVLYALVIIWYKKYGLALAYEFEMVQMVQRLNPGESFSFTIPGQEEVRLGLNEEEIHSIAKCKLNRYEELNMIVTWTDSGGTDDLHSVCAVCIENIRINEWYKQLPKCEHYFHADCIDKWLRLRKSCPVCRQIIGSENVERSHMVEDGIQVLEE